MNSPPDLPMDRFPMPVLGGDPLPSMPPLPAIRPPVSVGLSDPPAESSPPPEAEAEPAVGTPAPQPRWVREAIGDLFTLSRKKLVVASSAGSVVAVGLALNALFSGAGLTPEPEPQALAATSPVNESQTRESIPTTPAPEPHKPETIFGGAFTGGTPPPAESVVPAPGATGIPDLSVPTVTPPAATPEPVIDVTPAPVIPSPVVPAVADSPPAAVASPIIPAAYTDPAPIPPLPESKLPAAPAVPSAPPALPTPTLPENKEPKPATPPNPDLPVPTVIPESSVPASPTGVPAVKSIDIKPPAMPGATPDPVVPKTPDPVAPKLEPIVPKPVDTTERKAEPPAPKPVVEPLVPKSSEPVVPKPLVTPEGKSDALPPPPAEAEPPPVTFKPLTAEPLPKPKESKPTGGTLNLTKPPAEASVPPTAGQEPPKSDFDVDLHYPKAGDTYESISRQHYRDARYADALRQFNRGVELDRGVAVNVPPMYVLRQRAPSAIRPASEAGRGLEWASSPSRADTSSYTVPRRGMTLKDVAADVLGDSREWSKVWDLNPRLDPNAPLAEGTRLQLPPDARVRK